MLFSVGYRDDEEAYPVKLHAIPVGKIDPSNDDEDHAELESAMGKAASSFADPICHELFVTAESEILMVILARE